MELQDFLKSYRKIVVLHEPLNSKYYKLDLSISNKDLTLETCGTSDKLGHYIDYVLQNNQATIAFGGYNEERAIYRRSTIFSDNESEERNIHIGLDLWAPAGTSVFAAFDGEVHSFNYNRGKGNYGPTIIISHEIENLKFYTLYGHLDVAALSNLTIGDKILQGQQIAVLGDESVNGDYPAHLHFQIIKNIANFSGDYPGVCKKSETEYYLSNCPDPNLLLKIY